MIQGLASRWAREQRLRDEAIEPGSASEGQVRAAHQPIRTSVQLIDVDSFL